MNKVQKSSTRKPLLLSHIPLSTHTHLLSACSNTKLGTISAETSSQSLLKGSVLLLKIPKLHNLYLQQKTEKSSRKKALISLRNRFTLDFNLHLELRSKSIWEMQFLTLQLHQYQRAPRRTLIIKQWPSPSAILTSMFN